MLALKGGSVGGMEATMALLEGRGTRVLLLKLKTRESETTSGPQD